MILLRTFRKQARLAMLEGMHWGGQLMFYGGYRFQIWSFKDHMGQGQEEQGSLLLPTTAACRVCDHPLVTGSVTTLFRCFSSLIIHKGDLKCPCESRVFVSSVTPTIPTTQVPTIRLCSLKNRLGKTDTPIG